VIIRIERINSCGSKCFINVCGVLTMIDECSEASERSGHRLGVADETTGAVGPGPGFPYVVGGGGCDDYVGAFGCHQLPIWVEVSFSFEGSRPPVVWCGGWLLTRLVGGRTHMCRQSLLL
jgi:hypothetical protein